MFQQRLKVIYGKLRRLFRLKRFVPTIWFFDEQTVWMVYDSHDQVYVTGSISFTHEEAQEKAEEKNAD